jgi:hypothetical protein
MVDGSVAGLSSDGRCRSVRMTLPRSRLSAAPGACGLPVSARRVPLSASPDSPVSAGCADLARLTSADQQAARRARRLPQC